eukprot:8426159-Ditylum_brightwellii.AAC.1
MGAGGAPKIKEMNIIKAATKEYELIEESKTRKHSSGGVPTMDYAAQHQSVRRSTERMLLALTIKHASKQGSLPVNLGEKMQTEMWEEDVMWK